MCRIKKQTNWVFIFSNLKKRFKNNDFGAFLVKNLMTKPSGKKTKKKDYRFNKKMKNLLTKSGEISKENDFLQNDSFLNHAYF